MPLLPFAQCSDVPEPTECSLLADTGEAILGAAVVGLEPFIPPDGCGPPFTTLLSLGQPIAEFHDALSVWLVSFGPTPQPPKNFGCGEGVWPTLRAEWRVELWENCYPTFTEQGTIPTPDEIHAINRHAYAHGLGVYNAAMQGWINKTVPWPSRINSIEYGPLLPSPPQGGSFGWKFTVYTEFG